MTKYIILFIYVAINSFLLILNWSLFTQSNELNFGFGVYYASPFILLQVLGLLSIVAFAAYDGYKDLKSEIDKATYDKKIVQLEKDAEITGIKNQMKKAEPAASLQFKKQKKKAQIQTMHMCL